ncbi:MAG: glycosyltransferase [Butyrivibrio sp.]|uniref:glycosyltransferase n=1 Tax=Butyrivibrio sp. TaxID=28121 RepID=UPI0025B93139|nr:glycosyltransferase [Butyrivibrio sp.]MBQ6589071.1 glycosyltransferase [Butyrivibrio sp.]
MDATKKNLMLMVPMLHQGGFERVCVATARLMQQYYNVYVLIFSSKDINYDITGLNIVDIDVPAKKGIVNKVTNILRRIAKVKQKKKELKIDISYSFGSSANYVNVLSRGKEKVLTGLRCQTDMERPDQVKLFCKKSDQVLSCSREIMRQLLDDYGYDKSSFIYNPLDVIDVEKKASEEVSDYPFEGQDVKVIATMGRNDYIKGMWHLLKAFSLVYKKHPEARLIVLGAGDWSAYEELAKKLGVEGKAQFPGVRKNPFPYVALGDIYVCSSNHEGFPNAVLEAMAMEMPVISADCKTGPREILLSDEEYNKLLSEKPDGASTDVTIEGEYGVLVPDMDENVDMDPDHITDGERVLADAICSLLERGDKREYYSSKAYERALLYTPDKYRDSIHEILRRYE